VLDRVLEHLLYCVEHFGTQHWQWVLKQKVAKTVTSVVALQMGYYNLCAHGRDYQKTAMSKPLVSLLRASCPGYGPSSFAILLK
jgi:hypothetical protein